MLFVGLACDVQLFLTEHGIILFQTGNWLQTFHDIFSIIVEFNKVPLFRLS